MRLIADIPFHPEYKRLMLNQTQGGVLLYYFITEQDGACVRDDWFENVETAYEYAAEKFHTIQADWKAIPDAVSGCQDDFIQPVRVKGREKGSPEWGTFEKFVNGAWIEYAP